MTLAWLLALGGAAALALVATAALWHSRAAGPRVRLAATGAGWLALLAALILFDLSIPQLVNSYFWQIIIKVGIYITLAVSLNIINGIAGQFSMGHAGFMAIGAYTAAYLTMMLGAGSTGWINWLPWNGPWNALAGAAALSALPLGLGAGLIFLLALVVGGLAAALAGYFVGIPSLRLRGDYLAIVTLGFGEIIRNLIANVNVIGASRGLPGVPHYASLFWVYLFAAICIFVSYRLLASGPGRAMLAVREDEIAAAAVGINTTRTKIQAFAIGTFFAGIAGGLLAHHFEYLHPDYFKFDKSFEVIIMVVLGGMGSVSGAAVAAVLIALAPEVLRYAKDLLGNLTEPAVLYAAAPFILFALIYLALFAADVLTILARAAARLASAMKVRPGARLGPAALARLRQRGGSRLLSLPAAAVARAPAWVRDAGLGAVAGIGLAVLHRAFIGTTLDPRLEYWAATMLGMAAGGLIGLKNGKADGPTVMLYGGALVFVAGLVSILFRTQIVARLLGRDTILREMWSGGRSFETGVVAVVVLGILGLASGALLFVRGLTLRSFTTVRSTEWSARAGISTAVAHPSPAGAARPAQGLRGLAVAGLLAPVAFAAAWGLETGAPALLARLSVSFREFPDPRMVLYSIMLIALMLTRPTGLFGSSEIWVWWRERRASKAGGRT